ncbi:MAG: monomeric [FeFe] hydrogenase [Treponemataceae bacterium]|nr:monomeric [FeFe] hydrogenase [Treponemataceae bacterium]
MLNINNNAANIKREILVRIARLQLAGALDGKDVNHIPRELIPKDRPPFRCCVYHDRELIKQRALARLGFSVEAYDEDKDLEDYAAEALEREKPTWPMLTVLHEACNACVKQNYIVTNACQGCFARPCMMNCPKKAIAVDRHAHIDAEKCIHCGICAQNCPYHAIIKVPVPCEEACPVGAISKGGDGHEQIDYAKCIFCGNCMRECPFGAMMDKSQLVDVIRRIMEKKRNVVAMYAPAIAAQFKAATGQFEAALLAAGFDSVLEVAVGADICADKEAGEFEERMSRGDKVMTTSCCSAYVRAVHIHVPELIPCVSETRSPMHYTAEIARERDPDCVTVFIGPCLAKRREGFDDEIVDYVLSVEDLNALFIAKEINPADLPQAQKEAVPSATGRNFARTGGVLEAVKARLSHPEILKPDVINGLNKAGMAKLAMYGQINVGKIPSGPSHGNLVEVMACEGGCIGGPSVITSQKSAAVFLERYVKEGAETGKSARKQEEG